MGRLITEIVLAALVTFGTTLTPLMQDGKITPEEWIAASVAGLGASLALLRQQPKSPPTRVVGRKRT
jgi:hypothetical protein